MADLEDYRNKERVLKQNKEIVRQVFAAIDSNNFKKLNELFSKGDNLRVMHQPGMELQLKE